MPKNAEITRRGQVVLKPVRSVAGSLSSYAKKRGGCFEKAGEKAILQHSTLYDHLTPIDLRMT